MLCTPQRRDRHFKSGQATANKRSLVHLQVNVHGWGGLPTTGNVRQLVESKMHRCRCSPVGPRRVPNPPAKEWETCTHRANASLRGTPGPIVSSSHCLCSLSTDQRPAEKWSGQGRTSRTNPRTNCSSVGDMDIKRNSPI